MNFKEWVYKKFFPEEIDLISFYRESWQRCGEELTSVKKELQNYKEMQKLMERIIFLERDILGFEKNKKGHQLIVTSLIQGNSISLYLHSKYYKQVQPYIDSTVITDSSGAKRVRIDDFQMIDNSIGNGNIAMKYFLEQVNKIDAEVIYGELVEKDKDNFIRSIPFYKKYGFEIKLNNTGTHGSIKLITK